MRGDHREILLPSCTIVVFEAAREERVVALMVASPESVEGAFDAFVASFVERSVLTEANADGLTDKVASAATEEAREVVMCEALRALLKPGMVVTLTSAKSEAFKVRAGTVLYVPPDKRTDARKVHMLSSEADGSEIYIYVHRCSVHLAPCAGRNHGQSSLARGQPVLGY